jgi:HEAT repeat protein
VVTTLLVQEFLDARRQAFPDSETFQNARRALLAIDKAEVLAVFETRLQVGEDEDRAAAIEGLALLYGREATDTLLPWINDPSTIVRWVAYI